MHCLKHTRKFWLMSAACLLILVASLTILTSCHKTVDPDPAESDTIQETGQNPAESGEATGETPPDGGEDLPPIDPNADLTVIADGKTDYVLSVAANVKQRNPADVRFLRNTLTSLFGICPPDATGNEKTRVLSLSYDNQSDDPLDRSITVDPKTGNIRLVAGGNTAMERIILEFLTRFCAVSDGKLIMDPKTNYTYRYAEDQIDNSGLLSYQGGDKVVLEPSDEEGILMTPAWLKTAVIVELRIDIASIGGTFENSYDLLDFYAQTGVNALWLAPIYERSIGGNGYGNVGLHRVEPALTGTEDQEEGWNEIKKFIDYAHTKGMYIFLDLVSWGVMNGTQLTQSHPDWFEGEAWGNAAFNWKNEEFREWFISQAVANIERTGADGYRCDCEPFTAGYEVYAEIRRRLSEKGIHIVLMSEDGGERKNAFDFELDGVLDYSSMTRGQYYQDPVNFFTDGYLDIVRTTQRGEGLGAANIQKTRRQGTFRFYTSCVTHHDFQRRVVNGNRLKIGYSAIYSPYIPVWYMGDEFGVVSEGEVLYVVYVDYSLLEQDDYSALFYEDVKKMVQIRRSYPDIYEQFPINHRHTKICRVKTDGFGKLTNYALYSDDRMIIIVGNNEEGNPGICTVHVPFEEWMPTPEDQGGPDQKFCVTNLLTGLVVKEGTLDEVKEFVGIVPFEYCGVYLVEKK